MGTDLDALIARRVRGLRAAQGLTLDVMAMRSGVSRAMLSRIERGESSPTAGSLAKLCGGLGVTLAALLAGDAARASGPVARRSAQPVWRDPASGYLRRAVSPAGAGLGIAIAEVELPVGAAVLLDPLDTAARERHAWLLAGAVEIACGADVLAFGTGDWCRLDGTGPVGIRNAGPEVARCALVTARAGGMDGTP